ncbi:MAG: hypothetical protein EOP62_13770 [Sphingomonadales bacterium]|nr:MAG: hypothetical protein EOP62_13770 [Sphingomonadales bacterium]
MMIRLIARGTVEAGDREQFATLVHELVERVRTNEAGNTLAYDFYLTDDDADNCVVHECYTDISALAAHVQNIGANAGKLAKLFKTGRLEVYGAAPQPLVSQLERIAPVSHFPNLAAGL